MSPTCRLAPSLRQAAAKGSTSATERPWAPNHQLVRATVLAWALIGLVSTGTAKEPHHFVFYGSDRERIEEKTFLETPALVGAQLKYDWKELEPKRGAYDFSPIRHDLKLLKAHKKRLFVQLQDISFVKRRQALPDYLLKDPEFHGGVEAGYYEPENGRPATFGTWIPRRWDPAVRGRFLALVSALGREFDGRIEGINFAETSVDEPAPGAKWQGWSPAGYFESIRTIMRSARNAFKKSKVIVYANFMPSDPNVTGDGQAFLKGIYRYADEIGVGVGGPDILPNRWFQQHRSLPLIAARAKGTVAGMAVQDGNLADKDKATGKKVTASELAEYARQTLHLDYIFWGTEKPYWTEEVLPLLRALPPKL